jgi:hypothetical protein
MNDTSATTSGKMSENERKSTNMSGKMDEK